MRPQVNKVAHFARYPNELMARFLSHNIFASLTPNGVNFAILGGHKSVLLQEIEGLFEDLRSSSSRAGIQPPYGDMTKCRAHHFFTLLYLRLTGATVVHSEGQSSHRRYDLWFKLAGGNLQAIVEIKCADGSKFKKANKAARMGKIARKALQQINTGGYKSTIEAGVKLKLVGLVFDTSMRTVAEGGVAIMDHIAKGRAYIVLAFETP